MTCSELPSTARESRPFREGRVFRPFRSEPRTEQGGRESRPLSLRFPRIYHRRGRTEKQQLGKSGGGLAFLRHCQTASGRQPEICDFWPHQKREPARVRLRHEAQSGGWHCPHGPSGYPSTPLPRGTDGLRANRSTREGNLASGGVGPPGPTREETSAFTPRRMSSAVSSAPADEVTRSPAEAGRLHRRGRSEARSTARESSSE